MRGATWIVTAIMLAMGLAGCMNSADPEPASASGAQMPTPERVFADDMDPGLSQPIYTDRPIIQNLQIPSSIDGVMLDNWVFRPNTPDGVEVPVFINFSPYWGNLAGSAAAGGDAFSKWLIEYFVPRGYAVVLSSARGTGWSHGCFNMGGDIEQQDSYDVIEYFGAISWSNGNVGAGGKSYDGTIPNGAIVMGPPSLRTIFPVSGISEMYKYNYKRGIPFSQGTIFNTYYYALVGVANIDEDPAHLALMIEDIACVTLPENQAHGVGSGVSGDYTDYWIERNYTAEVANVQANVGVFNVHGLQDWNVKPDNVLPFFTALEEEGVVVKHWLHQEDHVYPTRADWPLVMLRWLDYWLKGVDTGILDEPLVQVQDNTGVWRHEQQWPPAHAEAQRLYFGNGVLSANPSSAGVATFADASLPGASQELRFTSDVLSQDLHYAGEPWIRLEVASDQPRGQVVAELFNVSADGTWDRINWGGLNLRHRVAMEQPELVEPGSPYRVAFPLHPQDDVIPAGNRLGVRIAASGGGFTTIASGATITMTLSETASLTLPVLTAEPWYEEPQPENIGCWAC